MVNAWCLNCGDTEVNEQSLCGRCGARAVFANSLDQPLLYDEPIGPFDDDPIAPKRRGRPRLISDNCLDCGIEFSIRVPHLGLNRCSRCYHRVVRARRQTL